MNALLRYVIKKGLREQFLIPLLLAPSAMLVTPLIVTGLYRVTRGRGSWPLSLAGKLTPAASADVLTLPALMFAAMIAATAAFWVYRPEMTGRTIGLFFLAQHPMIVPLSAMVFGFATAVLSYLLTLALLAFLTGAPMTAAATTAVAAFISILFAAAAGTLLVGFSSHLPTLIPAYVVTITAAANLISHGSPRFHAASIAAALILLAAAPFIWRRRCAA